MKSFIFFKQIFNLNICLIHNEEVLKMFAVYENLWNERGQRKLYITFDKTLL